MLSLAVDTERSTNPWRTFWFVSASAAKTSRALVWNWANSWDAVSAWVSVADFVVAIVSLLIWSAVASPDGRGAAVDRATGRLGAITFHPIPVRHYRPTPFSP